MIAKKIEQSLEQAGVAINRTQPWDIQVHDNRWFRRVLLEKNLGMGESYMDGWWDCAQLDVMIYRLLRGGLEDQMKGGLRYLLHFIPGLVFNLQSKARSRIIAENGGQFPPERTGEQRPHPHGHPCIFHSFFSPSANSS